MELNELKVILEKQLEMGHPNTTSLEEFFGTKPNLNKDLVIAPQKSDIKNLTMAFVALEPNMLGLVPFPSSDGIDDVSTKQERQKTQNGMENSVTWCKKNQAGCYII